jgi:DNA-binding NarL/FixJ family response regulator
VDNARVRILVVDDHEIVRKGVCSLLAEQCDFEIVCDVADGMEAVAKAEEFRPDVIVLDISMPGIDGLEVARRVRKQLPQTAIVFLTQHTSAEVARQALQAGGNGYVSKSDIVNELISTIRKSIEEVRQSS